MCSFTLLQVGCLQFECVPIFVCLFLCVLRWSVLVNCLLNVFAICVGEVSIFSLKFMVLFLCCVGVVLASPCIVLYSKEYVCCICDPSVCLGVPSICQICMFV